MTHVLSTLPKASVRLARLASQHLDKPGARQFTSLRVRFGRLRPSAWSKFKRVRRVIAYDIDIPPVSTAVWDLLHLAESLPATVSIFEVHSSQPMAWDDAAAHSFVKHLCSSPAAAKLSCLRLPDLALPPAAAAQLLASLHSLHHAELCLSEEDEEGYTICTTHSHNSSSSTTSSATDNITSNSTTSTHPSTTVSKPPHKSSSSSSSSTRSAGERTHSAYPPHLRSLTLSGYKGRPYTLDIASLAASCAPSLHHLHLGANSHIITNIGHLSRLTHLRSLTIEPGCRKAGSDGSDLGALLLGRAGDPDLLLLAEISAGMSHLSNLILPGCQVSTVAAWQALCSMPLLKELELAGLGGELLAAASEDAFDLPTMGKLASLGLPGSYVSDSALWRLLAAGMPALEALQLDGMHAGAAAVPLAKVTRLVVGQGGVQLSTRAGPAGPAQAGATSLVPVLPALQVGCGSFCHPAHDADGAN
jgi:hypothetical protein